MSNILVILHEAGHALYEMGLPTQAYGSPLGESISLGIHESQSRFWETRIGTSVPFWKYFLPILKKTFGGKLADISLEAFWRAMNKSEPSFIRVEADEVTYPLHVILRYELECDLITGELKANEVPEAWNDKMTRYLGITPQNNREGCLQDIHWAMGAMGYFPTYTMGTLYASQIFDAFAKENKDWESRVARGELRFIRTWLQENIHQYGKQYTSAELMKKITGDTLSATSFLKYLDGKYR